MVFFKNRVTEPSGIVAGLPWSGFSLYYRHDNSPNISGTENGGIRKPI